MSYVVTAWVAFVIGFTVAATDFDTYASTYKAAEAACVELNSHVKSFDIDEATCENTAVIGFKRK